MLCVTCQTSWMSCKSEMCRCCLALIRLTSQVELSSLINQLIKYVHLAGRCVTWSLSSAPLVVVMYTGHWLCCLIAFLAFAIHLHQPVFIFLCCCNYRVIISSVPAILLFFLWIIYANKTMQLYSTYEIFPFSRSFSAILVLHCFPYHLSFKSINMVSMVGLNNYCLTWIYLQMITLYH